MRFRSVMSLLLVAGCGGRVSLPDEPAETSDAGKTNVAADTAVGLGPADGAVVTEASPPSMVDVGVTDPPPSAGWGDGPAITSMEACGSSATVDKLIAHSSAPLAPFPTPSPIDVIVPGTTCETIDARSPTGEYAFSGKCGLVDKTKTITLVIREGIKSVDGRPMRPGTHVYYPSGKTGRLCGIAYFEREL
jgi:hypothetical protein